MTRAGGPFGNFFADGTADRWWAYPAASTELGFWLASASVILGLWGFDPALRGRRAALKLAGGAVGLGLLIVALALTHSRESFVALLLAALVVTFTLHRRRRLPRPSGPARGYSWRRSCSSRARYCRADGEYRVSGSFAPACRCRRRHGWKRGKTECASAPGGFLSAGEWEACPHMRTALGAARPENTFLQAYMETGMTECPTAAGAVLVGARAGLRRLSIAPQNVAAGLAGALLTVLAIHGTFGTYSATLRWRSSSLLPSAQRWLRTSRRVARWAPEP